MITRVRDQFENASSVKSILDVGPSGYEPSAEVPEVSGNDDLGRVTALSHFVGIGATVGFLAVMAILGSASAVAWRDYTDRPPVAGAQISELYELRAALSKLELSQQQIVKRVEALEQFQRKTELRVADFPRISEQLTSFRVEMEKPTTTETQQIIQKKTAATGVVTKSKPATQAR
jgi:hypothetical protein